MIDSRRIADGQIETDSLAGVPSAQEPGTQLNPWLLDRVFLLASRAGALSSRAPGAEVAEGAGQEGSPAWRPH